MAVASAVNGQIDRSLVACSMTGPLHLTLPPRASEISCVSIVSHEKKYYQEVHARQKRGRATRDRLRTTGPYLLLLCTVSSSPPSPYSCLLVSTPPPPLFLLEATNESRGCTARLFLPLPWVSEPPIAHRSQPQTRHKNRIAPASARSRTALFKHNQQTKTKTQQTKIKYVTNKIKLANTQNQATSKIK